MHTLDLAYVGRGIHEELVAYVADQEGYFEDEGVHVALRDGTRWDITRVRGCATIGLGRGLLSRLTDDIEWTVLSVNTDRPLFWFLGNASVKSMADLRGRRDSADRCLLRCVLVAGDARRQSGSCDRPARAITRHASDACRA